MSRRRANGEGSIYKRRDGLWVGQYTIQTFEGVKTKYIYAKVKKDVASKLTKAIASRDSGVAFDAQSLSTSQYLSQWLDSIENSLRPGTFKRYEQSCRLHIIPSLGTTKVDKIGPLQLQSLYRSKLKAGLSPRTVQIIHATLHKAFKQAVKWMLIPMNPAVSVEPPKAVSKEVKPLNEEQVKLLLETARGDKLEALYVLAITTGMRQGELLALQWSDIDLDTATVRVRRTIFDGQVQPPKTSKGKRNITLTEHAVQSLRNHKRESEWVFCTRVGTPVSCHNLTRRSWKPLLREAGLPDMRFHDLRHTCATLLLSKGVHPKIVQELLGHANISITLDTYSHFLPNMQEKAVAAMEEIIE